MAQTDVEVCTVARTLAYALGATRAEVGTIKALHAVLLQMTRPGMSDMEAVKSTRKPPNPTSYSGSGRCSCTPTLFRSVSVGCRRQPHRHTLTARLSLLSLSLDYGDACVHKAAPAYCDVFARVSI